MLEHIFAYTYVVLVVVLFSCFTNKINLLVKGEHRFQNDLNDVSHFIHSIYSMEMHVMSNVYKRLQKIALCYIVIVELV